MAARVNKIRHDDETRAKIQTSQLINRLQDHVFGQAEVSATQMKAIELLLRKTLPDLSAIDHSGDMTLRHEDALDELDDEPGTEDPPAAKD
jgi:hypothetical protein